MGTCRKNQRSNSIGKKTLSERQLQFTSKGIGLESTVQHAEIFFPLVWLVLNSPNLGIALDQNFDRRAKKC